MTRCRSFHAGVPPGYDQFAAVCPAPAGPPRFPTVRGFDEQVDGRCVGCRRWPFVGLCALPNQGTPPAAAGSQVNTTDTEGGNGVSGGGSEAPGPANSVPHAKGVPTANQVLAALRASGVKLVVEPGWNLEWDLPNRRADWRPIGVMLHHTGAGVPGNAPSRQFLLDYRSPSRLTRYDGLTGGRRGCHFLIGRDGTVYFMRATRGPHAGTGGPMQVGRDTVTADNGNGRFFGIEIESAGYSSTIHAGSNFIDGFGGRPGQRNDEGHRSTVESDQPGSGPHRRPQGLGAPPQGGSQWHDAG